MRNYFHPFHHNNIIYLVTGIFAGMVICLCLTSATEKLSANAFSLLGALATIFAGYMAIVSVHLPVIWQSRALLDVIKNEAAQYAVVLESEANTDKWSGAALLSFETQHQVFLTMRQAAQLPAGMLVPNEQLFLLPRHVVEKYLALRNLSQECQNLTRDTDFRDSEEAHSCLEVFLRMASLCREIRDYIP